MLRGEELLDPALVDRFGPPDAATLQEILNICKEALIKVLGPDIGELLSLNVHVVELAAPWVWDLARGLHYQSVCGPAAPSTLRLIDQFSSAPLPAGHRDWLADRVDCACILTGDRIAEFVEGRGAIRKYPLTRERNFPWYGRLEVGYRIHLTTEALRLMPSLP